MIRCSAEWSREVASVCRSVPVRNVDPRVTRGFIFGLSAVILFALSVLRVAFIELVFVTKLIEFVC
jgi:hypothetical protein